MMKFLRLPFLFLALISLLAGLATGLNRMGWDLNIVRTSLHHGAIMVGGFLGTLISLEKIIPLKNRSLYLIPVLSGMSVIFFFCGMPRLSFSLLLLASAALTCVFIYYWLVKASMKIPVNNIEIYPQSRATAINFWSLLFLMAIPTISYFISHTDVATRAMPLTRCPPAWNDKSTPVT